MRSKSCNSAQASGYKKIRSLAEMIKISVTNIELYYKNYLILTKNNDGIFSDFGVSLDNFCSVFEKISKKIMFYFLSKLILLSCRLTFQVTVSPFSNSKISRMIFGMDVDNVPPVDCTLVSYFNSIPPFILLMVFILLYW